MLKVRRPSRLISERHQPGLVRAVLVSGVKVDVVAELFRGAERVQGIQAT